DLSNGHWYLWAMINTPIVPANNVLFPFQSAFNHAGDIGTAQSGGATLLFAQDGTSLSSIDEDNLQDFMGGVAYNIGGEIQTPLIDCGNRRMKFWGRLDLVADQVPTPAPMTIGTPSLLVEVKDNDYQSSAAAKLVFLDTVRPATFGWGASRARAWRVVINTQDLNNVVRFESMQQEYEQGT
ncbi:MAG: hypothetical protein ACMG51_10205, partial [Ginsengibacter sp.]